MLTRRPLHGVTVGLVLLLSPALRAAQVRTQNFLVEAPTPQLAQQFGQMAEHYRKQKAVEWLGQEMPPWPKPCPLVVKPTMAGPQGATRFNYDFRGGYEVIDMNIAGDVERMLHSVLPHEVTHTVFAHFFRCPVPRWADEGGAVLSEDDWARRAHERVPPEILRTPGRAFTLRQLLRLSDYPEDVGALYGQGYSVTHFLVESASRKTFLAFVGLGMRRDWDQAVRTHYRYKNVEEMERAWLRWQQDKSRPEPRNPPPDTRVAFP